ncbi:MAG: hypothetical protein WC254_00020 [Candidatus Woesearchaeota archaeon]
MVTNFEAGTFVKEMYEAIGFIEESRVPFDPDTIQERGFSYLQEKCRVTGPQFLAEVLFPCPPTAEEVQKLTLLLRSPGEYHKQFPRMRHKETPRLWDIGDLIDDCLNHKRPLDLRSEDTKPEDYNYPEQVYHLTDVRLGDLVNWGSYLIKINHNRYESALLFHWRGIFTQHLIESDLQTLADAIKIKGSRKDWKNLRELYSILIPYNPTIPFNYAPHITSVIDGPSHQSNWIPPEDDNDIKSVWKKYAPTTDILDKIVELDRIFAEPQTKYDSLADILNALNVPEEVRGNKVIWENIRTIDVNHRISTHKSYKVTTRNGERLFLKIHDNPMKAEIEAAANYYLSGSMSFIVPGLHPKPLEANGLYVTVQQDVSQRLQIEKPVEFWIEAIAIFHREAEHILTKYGVNIPSCTLRQPEYFREMVDKTAGRHPLDYSARLEESCAYLAQLPRGVSIGDRTASNCEGNFLLDLEGVNMGPQILDLPLVLIKKKVPPEAWDHYMNQYLTTRGTDSFDNDMRTLREAMPYAAAYAITKEVLGISTRRITPRIKRQRGTLLSYLC